MPDKNHVLIVAGKVLYRAKFKLESEESKDFLGKLTRLEEILPTPSDNTQNVISTQRFG